MTLVRQTHGVIFKFIADWESIRLRKQNQVDTNSVRENRLRVHHDYAVGDKVLITDKGIHRRLNCNTRGPYEISQIHANSTVCVSKGGVTERVNIRRGTPYID